MRVSVKDASGRELDRDVAWFRVGRPAAELTGFEAAPDPFKPGEKVVARFRVENTGTCAISGEGVLAVSRGGSLVEEIREKFTGLKPGKDRAFELAWDTEGAERDAVYGLAGLARFEGGATEAQRTEASTNARPVASFTASAESVAVNEEVEFDASGTTDPDGRVAQLEWEFGDGGTAAGPKVRHGYSEPDSYRVRLLATDDKGRPAAAELVVVVTGD
ncbi:PKD domain-containing protein [candidate division WOR-3 bacterium]|nr:PKD domain-containing protein [candidate division WOR-3 bacterium]